MSPNLISSSLLLNQQHSRRTCPPLVFSISEPNNENSQDQDSINENHLDFKLFGQKEKRILHAENAKFEYIGKNFGEQSEKNQETKYLLGVLSDTKKRMKLFDIDHIFNMKHSKKVKFDEEELNPSTKLNALEQKQMLVAEFGTKKSKKKLQQMLNNIVEVMKIIFFFEKKLKFLKKRKKTSIQPTKFRTFCRKKLSISKKKPKNRM